jgi:hypothetical protein
LLADPPGCGASSSCGRSLVAVGAIVPVLSLPFALSILLPFAPASQHATHQRGPARQLAACLLLAASRQSWRITPKGGWRGSCRCSCSILVMLSLQFFALLVCAALPALTRCTRSARGNAASEQAGACISASVPSKGAQQLRKWGRKRSGSQARASTLTAASALIGHTCTRLWVGTAWTW